MKQPDALLRFHADVALHEQVDGVYVANVADQKAEPELKLLGGLQAVLFNIHVCRLGRTLFLHYLLHALAMSSLALTYGAHAWRCMPLHIGVDRFVAYFARTEPPLGAVLRNCTLTILARSAHAVMAGKWHGADEDQGDVRQGG